VGGAHGVEAWFARELADRSVLKDEDGGPDKVGDEASPEDDDQDRQVLPEVESAGCEELGFGEVADGFASVEAEGEEGTHETGEDGDCDAPAEVVVGFSGFGLQMADMRAGIAKPKPEKLGGTVVGHVRAPFGTSDFSSFLLQAQQSNASVIAFGTGGADTVNLLKQAAEFHLAKRGVRVVPLQLMIDEVKAIGLELGQGNFALMAFHHERSPEAKAWSQRFFDRVNAMPTAIQAGTYSAVRHYLQAIKDIGTDEPLAVAAKMRATPVNDMFATGGYLREDGRMVHDEYLTEIKTPAESTGPWDLVKILKTVRGEETFRPLAESECPLIRRQG